MKTVALITQGDPMKLTGGFLYHRRLAEIAPEFGVRIEFLSFPDWGFPWPLLAAPRIAREWRRLEPEGTLVDSLVAAYFSPLALLRPLSFVGIVHQLPGGIDHHPWRTKIQRFLDKFSYRRARALIACSSWLAERLEGLCRKVEVAIPGRPPATDEISTLDLRRGRKKAILCVANWLPVKDVGSLLDAFARLPRDLATLHLVGERKEETPYGERLSRRVRQSDLRERVVLHGPVQPERLQAFYASADVFALTSLGETYGSVYAEAMTAGLPVVGWRTGNLPHLVESEKEGLLLPPGDIEGLSEALTSLLGDDDRLSVLSQGAEQRAARLCSWEETTRRVLEVVGGG